MKDLSGRVAVVTGAASGIGRALVDRFASEKMKVVLADVEEGPLSVAVSEVQKAGVEAIGVKTDVSKAEQVEALAQKTIDAFGAVHVVCNNAGVVVGGSFAEAPLSSWNWVLGVNLWGVIHGCHAFLPLLRQQDEGHIVNTASTAGFRVGLALDHSYIVSKFAVVGLTEALDAELRQNGDNIGVSTLIPSMARTNFLRAERNAPADVPEVAPERDVLLTQLEKVQVERADPPELLAGLVLEAIKERRFYVMPHPELVEEALEFHLAWVRTGVRPD